MKKYLGDLLRCSVIMIAAFSLITTLSSCGEEDAPTYYGSSGDTVITHDLDGGLTITTTAHPPDYTTAEVVVAVDSILCRAVNLTNEDRRFSLGGGCCGSKTFALDFQYVPASGLCRPGGLYLIEGDMTAPEDGSTFNYRNMEIAAWDAEGNLLNPSFRPFNPPTLVSQAFQANWAPSDPLNTLGSWTYTVEYGAYGSTLPTDCSLETAVELTLTPAAENMAPRVYGYVVTESGTGEQITASISANDPAAPTASIELDGDTSSGVTRWLSFAGLDALRDAKAQTSMAFVQPAPVLPASSVFADPLSPFIAIDQVIDISSGRPPASLASHLVDFFSGLTAPLIEAYESSTPTIHVKISVYLSKPLGGGISTTMSLVMFPYEPYTPGFDDNNNCAILPDPGLVCKLATAVTAAAGSPDPSDSYIFDITFYEADRLRPAFRIAEAFLPVSKISK